MIIDCHVHAGPEFITWWKDIIKSEKDFLGYLTKCGINKAILNGSSVHLHYKNAKDVKNGNKYVLNLSKKYPGRFIPSVFVTPDYLKQSLDEMELYRKKHNVVWVGEMLNYAGDYSYDSPGCSKIFEKALELDMIVCIHAEQDEIDNVLKKFPTMTVVLPHPGLSRKEINNRINLVSKYKNTYLDLCGYGADRMGNVEEMVRRLGDDRIFFGSDFTVNDPGVVISRVKNAFISKKSKEKILYKNVLALLKSKGADLTRF
ncbi:MAG: hypothetical protein A3J83_05635 [Elusimicrobia bacterium RIFOXYA2_FULL_40_6]|nr:MAG: hypothetical protein A3J83_05635 [Elusimicrobia bacterium RIFOXYA2_FULL_40_6]